MLEFGEYLSYITTLVLAPLHYIVTEGLDKYGYKLESENIAKTWLSTGLEWFNKHGEFLEKYNVANPDLPSSASCFTPCQGQIIPHNS